MAERIYTRAGKTNIYFFNPWTTNYYIMSRKSQTLQVNFFVNFFLRETKNISEIKRCSQWGLPSKKSENFS